MWRVLTAAYLIADRSAETAVTSGNENDLEFQYNYEWLMGEGSGVIEGNESDVLIGYELTV